MRVEVRVRTTGSVRVRVGTRAGVGVRVRLRGVLPHSPGKETILFSGYH